MIEGLRVAAGLVIADKAMAVARSGEDELEIAVREHARLVYRIAYSVLRNHHDAEDATQEAFMRVLRYRRKLAGVKDRRAWMARIAWRVAVDRRKSMPAVESQVALEEVSEFASQIRSKADAADETLLAGEMADITGKLISTLPGDLRDAITLSTVEEMAIADIAEVLRVNEAAVRSRIFRARQILREKLAAVLGTL
jgi:RNA polymerase sigma-70 factor, ECF subfamily